MKNVEGSEVKTKYKAIIFDLDGTLIDTEINFKDMKIAIVNKLKEKFNIEFNNEQIYKARVTEILSYVLSKVNEKERNSVIQRVFEIAEQFEMPAAKEAKLRKNVVTVLEELKKRGVKLAVITNEGKRVTTFLIESFGIADYFDIIVTRDDVGVLKPNPKGLLKIIDFLKLDKSQILLIGDSHIEIETARNAGITAWGILNGFGKRNELIAKGAERVLDEIEDLLRFI